MKTIKLGIGEYQVSQEPCELVCHGLGSCIGLFLYDRIRKIGGGAHILLPENSDPRHTTDGRHAAFATDALLDQMYELGSLKGLISAKIAGGASISGMGSFSIGERNRSRIVELLMQRQVYLSKADTGGNSYRKASFNTHSGKLSISKINVELIL